MAQVHVAVGGDDGSGDESVWIDNDFAAAESVWHDIRGASPEPTDERMRTFMEMREQGMLTAEGLRRRIEWDS